MTTGGGQAKRTGLGLATALAVGLGMSLVAFGLSFQISSGVARLGLACGVVTGAVGGLIGLVLVGLTLDRKLQLSIAAMGASFLLRVLFVGGGLGLTLGPLHGSPLGFVGGFFPLFFAFVLLELALLGSRRGPAEGASSGNPQHA